MNITRFFPMLALLLSACANTQPVERILSDALEASGGERAWADVSGLEREGELHFAGLAGTFVSREDVAAARYVTQFELGPYRGAEGFDGRQAWFMDPSGDAAAQDAAAERRAARNQAWLAARGYWFPDRHPAEMTFGGTRMHDGRRFNVIEAVPDGGRPLELWFDAQTHRLSRIREDDGRGMREMSLTEYRSVGALVLPHRLIELDTATGQATEQRVAAFRVNVPFGDDVFSLPQVRVADFDWPAGADYVELPFALANNHIYVDVRVNGQGPLRFIVDTGGLNLLTRAAADRLGIEAEGALKASGTGEKTTDVGVARVERLSLGALDLRDQTFFVADLSELQDVEGVPFDGLVGFEVFRRFVVRIAYADGRLRLYLPKKFSGEGGGVRVPIRLNDRTPEIDGRVDGISGVFSVDTGSRSALDLHRPFVERHNLAARYCPCVETITGWGVGGPVRGRSARVARFEIGELTVNDVGVELSLQESGAYADSNLAGNIGGALLKRFNVTFDYSRNEMILEPHERSHVPDNFDKSGLWINRSGDELVVAAVVPGSAADGAGLREGDRISRVDAVAGRDVDLPGLRQRLRDAAEGTAVTFTVLRDGGERDIAVTLRRLTP